MTYEWHLISHIKLKFNNKYKSYNIHSYMYVDMNKQNYRQSIKMLPNRQLAGVCKWLSKPENKKKLKQINKLIKLHVNKVNYIIFKK